MEGVVLFLGVIGNIISVLMFLSPVKTFVGIVRSGSTEEFDSFPYICTLLSSCFWTYYGVSKPDAYLVATVNALGILVQIVYIALFIYFASPPKRAKTAILFGVVNVGLFGAGVWVTYLLLQGDVRIDAIGIISSALNVIMYASPLSAMTRVVTMRSVEYMPFLLSFFFFLNAGVWTLYALVAQDCFLGVPNGIGLMLGALQMVLYAIYNTNSISSNHTQPLLPNSIPQDHC